MDIPKEVIRTVESGIEPLKITYSPINNCAGDGTVAYRASVTVNSLQLGTLEQQAYTAVSDSSDTGIRLAEWAMIRVARDLCKFTESDKIPMFVSVHCPVSFAEQPDMYGRIKEIFRKYRSEIPKRLCLEFNAGLLESGSENVANSLKDLRLLGVQSMICGFGAGNCPVMKLISVSPDTVMIAPEITAYTDDRGKPALIPSLLQLIKSTGAEVIAEGDIDRERRRTLGRLGVIGIYDGKKELTAEEITETVESEDF